MRYDIHRSEPAPGARSFCAGCGNPVMAKCGSVNVWHWSHVAADDCDTWYEPMTDWHRTWQEKVDPSNREVIMGPHRADMVVEGRVVELQHSSISVEEIRAREEFYGPKMIWIFDAVDASLAGRLTTRRRGGLPWGSAGWAWTRGRRSIAHCQRPVILDTGVRLLNVDQNLEGVGIGGLCEILARTLTAVATVAMPPPRPVRESQPIGNQGYLWVCYHCRQKMSNDANSWAQARARGFVHLTQCSGYVPGGSIEFMASWAPPWRPGEAIGVWVNLEESMPEIPLLR